MRARRVFTSILERLFDFGPEVGVTRSQVSTAGTFGKRLARRRKPSLEAYLEYFVLKIERGVTLFPAGLFDADTN